MSVPAGVIQVACPACPAVIRVPIVAELGRDEQGRQTLVCDPDMTDLWAHAWTHEQPIGEP